MPREIPKAYEPQEIEERWARAWYDENLFRAEDSGTPDGPKFSIALPPPSGNVTSIALLINPKAKNARLKTYHRVGELYRGVE